MLSLRIDKEEFINRLIKRFGIKDIYFKPEYFTGLTNKLQKYFNGIPVKFNYKLDLGNAKPFYKKVWLFEKENIPYGKVMSYKEVAYKLGNGKAYRLVAQANANNPILLIIPCHRVINSDGSLGGFSCGIDIKKKLLELEQ